MRNCLIVIGNGFDLFHGIPSSYWGFYNYLKENSWSYRVSEFIKQYNYESEESILAFFGNIKKSEEDDTSLFLEKIEQFIDTDELWSNFEKALGDLDADALREYFSDEIVSFACEDWSESFNHSYQNAIQEALDFVHQISFYLKKWIQQLDINVKPKLSREIISLDAFYITFNYTRTLENVYGIPNEQICHIHGSVDDFGELIVGHGNKDSFKRTKKYSFDEDDDFRLIQGEKIIINYFKAAYKNVKRIIENKQKLWDGLKEVQKVYILGHSLSDVDMPYFEKIYQSVKSGCEWYVSYYEPEDRCYFERTLKQIGINENSIFMIKLN